MLRYISIIFISLLSGLYLFEIYLNYLTGPVAKKKEKFNQDLKEHIYKKNSGKIWDSRTRLEVYIDLKKVNDDVTVRYQPSNFLGEQKNKLFPLSGISNSDTIHCNENGYFSIYRSDRYGFNNPDEQWNSDEIEYMLIGDSFTHGSCVNRPNDITSILRFLSNKNALNLGYGGNGPLIEYAVLREYLSPKVKKVLWLYCESNDLFNLLSERNNKTLNNYLNDKNYSQNLKNKQNEIDILLKNKFDEEFIRKVKSLESENLNHNDKKENLKYKILRFLRFDKTKKIFRDNETKFDNEIFREFKTILKSAVELSKRNNSQFIFVYIPEYSRYNETNYSNENYLEVISIVKDLDVDIVDMTQIFAKEDNPKKFFPFEQFAWHYNVDGYKKVAKSIYEITTNNSK